MEVRKKSLYVFLIILLIAAFAGGYLLSWNLICKPLNENQFECCEQLARNVYAQKDSVLVEVSESFTINTTQTAITVRLADDCYRGKVVAKLQNGELVMTRDMESPSAIARSIICGVLSIIIMLAVLAIIDAIFEMSSYFNKVKQKREF